MVYIQYETLVVKILTFAFNSCNLRFNQTVFQSNLSVNMILVETQPYHLKLLGDSRILDSLGGDLLVNTSTLDTLPIDQMHNSLVLFIILLTGTPSLTTVTPPLLCTLKNVRFSGYESAFSTHRHVSAFECWLRCHKEPTCNGYSYRMNTNMTVGSCSMFDSFSGL